jgi:hypothetical protein
MKLNLIKLNKNKMNPNYKKQKDQVDQRTYEIRPKLPKKFTKTVNTLI